MTDCRQCADCLPLPSGKLWCHELIREVPESHCCQKYQEKIPMKPQDPPGWERIKENVG